jgi:mannosyltransferase
LARWWLATIVGVAVAAAPMLTWSWWQRSQVSWIQGPSWGDLNYLVTWLALGSAASVLLLGLLGYAGAARQPAGSRALAWLALPWLVVPPLVLMPVSFIDPVYSFRYVVFCLPAVALLAGAGLAAVRPVIRAGAAALIIVLALPVQQGLRTGGGGVRAASQALAAVQRPGDAVIFPGGGIPPWYLVYPQTLGRLRNIGVRQSGAASGRLYATAVPLPVLLQREQSVSRIWVFEMQPSWQDPARYLAPGFRFVTMLRPLHGSVFLALYQRSSGPSR